MSEANKCQGITNVSLPLTGPTSSTNIGSQRKNHPLFHETIRWKSDVPLTEGQLRSKRDEFWETAPAFDGRKEIWDALRAATVAAEALDFLLAQAILDGANIFLANGYLTECYDELGSHYKIPIYCLSHPVNIVKEDHDSESPAEYSEPVDGGEFLSGTVQLWWNSVRMRHTKHEKTFLFHHSRTRPSSRMKIWTGRKQVMQFPNRAWSNYARSFN